MNNMYQYIAMGSQYLSYACLGGTFVYLILYVAMFRKKKPLFAQYIFWYFFCVYMVGLLLATRVISDYGWQFGIGICEIVPFRDGLTLEKLLNAILFLPYGILLPAVTQGKWMKRRYVTIFVGTSVLIELIQFFFVGRLAATDDVIMNSLGALCGYGIFFLLQRLADTVFKGETFGVGTFAVLSSVGLVLFTIPCLAGVSLMDLVLMCVVPLKVLFPMMSRHAFDYSGMHLVPVYAVLLQIGLYRLATRHETDLWAKRGKWVTAVAGVWMVVLFGWHCLH